MFRMCLTQMRLRVDGLQTHFPHQPLNMFPVDLMPTPTQGGFYPPGTIKRRQGVLLVNQALQQKIMLIHDRVIVNAGSRYPKKTRLMADGDLPIGLVNEQHLLFMA